MKISIIQGDITKVKADAIVNAAHHTLMGGGGVDGAIHKNAGSELIEECIKLRNEEFPHGLNTGEAVATKSYGINQAKILIHTVGPRYYSDDLNKLKDCYINSLKIAEENDCKSIAFPAIATGAYGTPIEKSAEIVKEVLSNYNSKIIEEVILVLFTEEDKEVYNKIFTI
ncbi:MAG: macro domain-containing protein [Nanoarchaeota archaeon]|nr:macro domain-containing protein [Nanoarchaeota archaeon]